MGDFDKCIEVCLQAVEQGRELHADYKLIAKYFTSSIVNTIVNSQDWS